MVKQLRIVSFDVLNALLEESIFKPSALPNYDEEKFLKECSDVRGARKARLSILGRFDEDELDNDDADFWMQKSDGVSRCISVTLTSSKMRNDSLVPLIQSFLQTLSQNYLVYVDSSLDLDDPIYLAITKNEVLGSADKGLSLEPFGFST